MTGDNPRFPTRIMSRFARTSLRALSAGAVAARISALVVFSLAYPAEAIILKPLQPCQKEIASSGQGFALKALKILKNCRDAELAGASSAECSPTAVSAELEEARGKMRAGIGARCDGLTRLELERSRPLGLDLGNTLDCLPGGDCSVADRQAEAHDQVVQELLDDLYGDSSAGSALGVAERSCQAALADNAIKLLRKALKAFDGKCMAKFDRGKEVVDRPVAVLRQCATNNDLGAAVAEQATKLDAKSTTRCLGADISAIDVCGLGVGGVSTLAQAQACIAEAAKRSALALIGIEHGMGGGDVVGKIELDVASPDGHVVHPGEVEVRLRDRNGATAATTKTDDRGLLRFSAPSFGTHQICWGPAASEMCANDSLRISATPTTLSTIPLRPPLAQQQGACVGGVSAGAMCDGPADCPGGICNGAIESGVLRGRVMLSGGSPCYHRDAFLGEDLQATVTVKSGGGTVLAGPVTINREGDYYIDGVPAGDFILEARCDQAIDQRVSVGGSILLDGEAPIDFVFPNQPPEIVALALTRNGANLLPDYDGGVEDNFMPPNDMATPRQEIVNAIGSRKQFDELGSAVTAHTFSGYSTMLCGARLSVHARADAGGHEGDRLLLDFVGGMGSGWSYEAHLTDLTDDAGAWTTGADRRFDLDIASLPPALGGNGARVNLLASLLDGNFDIGVDGNVTVDSARLTVAACVFQGDVVEIAATTQDPDMDTVTIRWAGQKGGALAPAGGTPAQGPGSHRIDGTSVAWAPPSRPGLHTLELLASDGKGGVVKGEISVSTIAIGTLPDLAGKICLAAKTNSCKLKAGGNQAPNPSDGGTKRALNSDDFLSYKGLGTEVQACAYYNLVDPACVDLDCDGELDAGVDSEIAAKCTRLTLGGWWETNGFDPVDGSGGDASAYYLNGNDLGFGREMHCNITGFGEPLSGVGLSDAIFGDYVLTDFSVSALKAPGMNLLMPTRVACYVSNYSTNCADLANADPENANLAAEANQDNVIATVCMEYSPVDFFEGAGSTVKFFAYARGGQDIALADAPRVLAADLDGCGAKYIPQLCMNCHGGSYPTITCPEGKDCFDPSTLPEDIDDLPALGSGSPMEQLEPYVEFIDGFPLTPLPNGIDGQVPARDRSMLLQSIQEHPSSFLPFDQATLVFPTLTGFTEADQADDIRALNRIVHRSKPVEAIRDLTQGWYNGNFLTGTFDASWKPSDWETAATAEQDLYDKFVAVSCRGCHAAHESYPFVAPSEYPFLSTSALDNRVCDFGGTAMPHARLTYENYWRADSPQPDALTELESYIGGTCP